MQDADFINSLGLMDLISEKHKKIRSELMQRLEAQFTEKLSVFDIYLLSVIKHSAISISESARFMNISRQAAHKHAKRLETVGLVKVVESQHSRREKLLMLTNAGEQACAKVDQFKMELEQDLEDKLGKETYISMKALFKQDW